MNVGVKGLKFDVRRTIIYMTPPPERNARRVKQRYLSTPRAKEMRAGRTLPEQGRQGTADILEQAHRKPRERL
jgi:hypothetical protein